MIDCTILTTFLLHYITGLFPIPYFSLQLEEKDISLTAIGWIFSFYAFGKTFSGFIFAPIVQMFGRKNSMILGSALIGISYIAFGLMSYLDTKKNYEIYVILTSFL